jgi:diadenosine tetraphosphate (Ap4A) HIT family hydrolase
MPQPEFTLHPQIIQDTLDVGDLPLSRLRLMNEATYPWLILVPRRADIVEIIDLVPDERVQLMTEISQVSQLLKAETKCDKLNIAALGNMVRQLHIHVIARFGTDMAWPRPVWGQNQAVSYSEKQSSELISRLRDKLFIS